MTRGPTDVEGLSVMLDGAGCIAAREEAAELLSFAAGDAERLELLVGRRLTGEPLAWITGRVTFCGIELQVEPGVYVPRWQSEPLARRAAECLPETGTAIDLCTGSGAIAKVLATARPGARVVASEVDGIAAGCGRANGVEVYVGDLFDPFAGGFEGEVDVVVGVPPYVPSSALALLPRDTLAFESTLSYDGGDDGTQILRRALAGGSRFLRPGGVLLLELGGEQADILDRELARLDYANVSVLIDDDGDARGIEAVLGDRPPCGTVQDSRTTWPLAPPVMSRRSGHPLG